MYKVDVNQIVTLTQQDVDDIMATALDSGCSYWCESVEVVGGEYLGEWASDQISRGGELKFYDCESDDSWVLDLPKFLNGVKLWIESGAASEYGAFKAGRDELDMCQVDAIAADSIVQYGLFGELVFG